MQLWFIYVIWIRYVMGRKAVCHVQVSAVRATCSLQYIVVWRVVNNDRILRIQPLSSHGNVQLSHTILQCTILKRTSQPAQAREMCVSLSEPIIATNYMCKHMSVCKQTGRKSKCVADVCYCPQITICPLRGVNVLNAVRGECKACRWMEDFLLVSDEGT
jgi:hypothetical protein